VIARALEAMPIVAILRGITPDEVKGVGTALYDKGLRCIEVPLNSPSPFESIAQLASAMPADCVVGAGTVLSPEDVRKVRDAGGTLIVAPNTSPKVIQMAVAINMRVIPGVATPTEAFQAIECGATYLKLFPAGTYGPGHLKAMLAVLPKHIRVLAVGDIEPTDFAGWRAAGAAGFGLGSGIYRAGDSVADVENKIAAIVAALEQD
jgi:2-dehydro-3-deoxyphosphogalactonate aldolase